tara:strand:- start:57 stop:551 length:495 start_codon:yes stop_codon:yes gene_type:complete
MTELFKQDFKTFDKPEIFYLFLDYGVGHLEKHYIYGYRKYRNRWYIKVKNMVDNISNTKRAKPRYEWEVVEPKHIDKDKNWLIKMAINHKIAKIDKAIEEYENMLSNIPEKIERLNKMKSKISKDQFNWNTARSIDSNLEKGVEPLRIRDNVSKYYVRYSSLSF